MEKVDEVKRIELVKLKPSTLNPRKHFDEVKMKDLVTSIKAKGVIEPIIVRQISGAGVIRYEVVCGERRFRASVEAKLKDIPAIVRELDDNQALEFQVIENLQREDMHPLEEAEGYDALIKKHGYKSVEDIAAAVGKSKGYIYGRLKLCDLIPENKKHFYEGRLIASVALLVARIPAHLQKEAGDRISGSLPGQGEPMSYNRAQEYISTEFMLRLKDAPFDTNDAMLHDGAGSCAMCKKRTGNQQELFPDISSEDICTDPACFKEKKAAGLLRALAKAKELGKKVLSDKEAKEAFTVEGPINGYVSLEETCEEDKLGRKYKQLTKAVKDAEITVGVNPHKGELVAMLTKREASRIRKKLGIVPAKKAAKAEKENKRKLQEKAEGQARAENENTYRAISAVIEEARRDKKQSFLRLMAEGQLETYLTPTAAVTFMMNRDPDVKQDEAIERVREHLKVIDDSELILFCLEMIVSEENEFGEGALLKKLIKHYEIQLPDIKASVVNKSEPTKSDEQAAPVKATPPEKSPYKREIKAGKDGVLEYKNKAGAKVVIKSKDALSEEEKKAAGEAIADVADALGLGADVAPVKAKRKKKVKA